MIRIQFRGTVDPLERMLSALLEDWDELERWAVRNFLPEKAAFAREEKEKLLAKIQEIREGAGA